MSSIDPEEVEEIREYSKTHKLYPGSFMASSKDNVWYRNPKNTEWWFLMHLDGSHDRKTLLNFLRLYTMSLKINNISMSKYCD